MTKNIYRPYKNYIYLSAPVCCIGMYFTAFSGYLFPQSIYTAIALVCISAMFFLITKWLYDSSNVFLVFSDTDLCIIERANCTNILWDDLKYAYFAKNFKGHRFLLLSYGALSKSQVKYHVNRAAITNQIFLDSCVVIFLDKTQNLSQLLDSINTKVSYVKYIAEDEFPS